MDRLWRRFEERRDLDEDRRRGSRPLWLCRRRALAVALFEPPFKAPVISRFFMGCPCRAALWFVEAISLLLRAGKRHGISGDVEHICKLIGSLHVFGESKHVNLVGRAGGED